MNALRRWLRKLDWFVIGVWVAVIASCILFWSWILGFVIN